MKSHLGSTHQVAWREDGALVVWVGDSTVYTVWREQGSRLSLMFLLV